MSQKSRSFNGWKKAPSRKEPPSGNDILRTKKSSEKEPTTKRATSSKKEKSHLKRENKRVTVILKRAIK